MLFYSTPASKVTACFIVFVNLLKTVLCACVGVYWYIPHIENHFHIIYQQREVIRGNEDIFLVLTPFFCSSTSSTS